MDASIIEDQVLPILSKIPAFGRLRTPQRRFLASGCSLIDVEKGETVCEQGEIPNGFFCVFEGQIKLAILSSDGGERVVEIMQPGCSFGESSMFLERPWPLYAQALVRSRMIFVSKQVVVSAIEYWPEFSFTMLAGLSARMHGLLNDLEACCLKSARQRVTRYLLDRERPYSNESDSGLVTLPAGKAVVASTLNLTPETFSRELHRLVDQGFVTVQKKSIYIKDVGALRNTLD